MDKKEAIEMLGGTPRKAAEALGYKSIQAIYMWPDVLPRSISDRVHGALARIKEAEAKKAEGDAQKC